MKLSVKAMAITSAIIWGGAVLGVAIANSRKPHYGREFLEWCASIYPGYHADRDAKQVAVGAMYAAVDGAATGAATALLYNAIAGQPKTAIGLPGSPDMVEIA
ncbi:MAG TPA: hypothetical protein VFM10_07740 [Terriglobales bacterium]|jgi:hypothetical protein|nr:hypothetical protein [Terriglobales bacterium]